jgi:hypothetical protein
MSADDLVHEVFLDIAYRTQIQPEPHNGRLRYRDIYQDVGAALENVAEDYVWSQFNSEGSAPLRVREGEPEHHEGVEHIEPRAVAFNVHKAIDPEVSYAKAPDHDLRDALPKALAALLPRHREVALKYAQGLPLTHADWSALKKARNHLRKWFEAHGFPPRRLGPKAQTLRGDARRLAWSEPDLDPWHPKRKPPLIDHRFTVAELEVFKATRERLSAEKRGLTSRPTPAMAPLRHFAALIPDDVHLRPTETYQERKEREKAERRRRVAKIPVKDTPGNSEVGGSWSERWSEVRGETLRWGRDGWG